MATIQFKSKIRQVYNVDDSLAWKYLKVPAITQSHCDMAAFRQHPRFGGFANSVLFPAMIKRELAARKIGDCIRMDQIPADVTVDSSGFLATVTIDLSVTKHGVAA